MSRSHAQAVGLRRDGGPWGWLYSADGERWSRTAIPHDAVSPRVLRAHRHDLFEGDEVGVLDHRDRTLRLGTLDGNGQARDARTGRVLSGDVVPLLR